jgi:hypothetical protein
MSNKQQTAVQFYLDKVFDIIGDDVLDKLSNEQLNKIRNLGIQAKEMEKERMKGMYVEGSFAKMRYYDGLEYIDAEQYYNETYGGGE